MIFTYNDFWHKRKIDNFDPYNVLLAIARVTYILYILNLQDTMLSNKMYFIVNVHAYLYIYPGFTDQA